MSNPKLVDQFDDLYKQTVNNRDSLRALLLLSERILKDLEHDQSPGAFRKRQIHQAVKSAYRTCVDKLQHTVEEFGDEVCDSCDHFMFSSYTDAEKYGSQCVRHDDEYLGPQQICEDCLEARMDDQSSEAEHQIKLAQERRLIGAAQ